MNDKGERLAKYLSRAGVCSRRDAERWIMEGRVTVDGKRVEGPALNVTGAEKIVVDGKIVSGKTQTQLWRYHKQKGLVTTHKDEQGRETIFDSLPAHMPRVISVGRLDLNSEGLILLTNDGALSRHLELPATGLPRKYRVRARGQLSDRDIDILAKGMQVDGVDYGPIIAETEPAPGANSWITMTLHEGKNREIRRVLSALGLDVNRLIRLSYGPFELDDLEPGEVAEVDRKSLSQALATVRFVSST